MFSKNLKYYRLKNGLSKKELAEKVGVSSMAITYYENNERRPSMQTINALAEALNIKVSDFLSARNENLVFVHNGFRKNSKLTGAQQEYVYSAVEEYASRFFSVVDVLGEAVLARYSAVPMALMDDVESNAKALRRYLRVSESGPVGNLVGILEDAGVLVCFLDIKNNAFSGVNGTVNGRPYVAVNQNMTPERIRSTIVHEVAHFAFLWPEDVTDKDVENIATQISGAFLFPEEDAKRELGMRRNSITNDMVIVSKKYGISMSMLVKRANLCGIVNNNVAKEFFVDSRRYGWKFSGIEAEEPMLFSQLVFRAVTGNEISVQKGAELLKKPYQYVAEQCAVTEG